MRYFARVLPSYGQTANEKYPLLRLVCDGFRVHNNEHKRLAVELYDLLNSDSSMEDQLKQSLADAVRYDILEIENTSVRDTLWRSRKIAT